ncbi:TRAP dicarboxylate transporter, DctP subunit [Spirochaeta thermophila DSM 6578]|uniref:TRAP dicarboxylate transporter, DctP subunit n=1 Tax=Winmispira thermophila (strain ATCC 700085 / DSM 6578 / Z-1203) TaxID=869211 RepID=G0GEI1_WINT7|nr:C4-dicarboxylate TRAP transporter substrate-binding protein [Spirochaeta thermophila]AEJ60669.1 TRAP dicarboxylate transporter, DctP subunit [Spirochaeta thermophila DSM 6578]
MRMHRMIMLVLSVLLLSALPLLASGTGEGEQAQEQYVLKFNHVLSQNDPFHKAFLNWAENAYSRSNGRLKIEVFHSAQLGVEEDIIEQIRMGANVGQNTDSARMGNYVPDIAVVNGPYFFDSLDDVWKLNESPTMQAWLKELETKYGIKVLSFNWVQGWRNLLTNKPIKSPDDLRGLRIRAPGAPIWMESIRSLGATPVAMAFSEIYSGIQTKVVDGAGNVNVNTLNTRLYEVVKYLNETKHILLVNFEVVSAKWFNSLPADLQTILQEECDKAGRQVSIEVDKIGEEAKAKLAEQGMTIIPYEEIDIAAFKQNSIKAYETLGILEARNKIFKELGKM